MYRSRHLDRQEDLQRSPVKCDDCEAEGVRIDRDEMRQACRIVCPVCKHEETDIGMINARMMMDYVRHLKANSAKKE